MSDTILGGNITLYYLDENRQKRLAWSGGAPETNTNTVNEVYSACADLFDESVQMDDGSVMSAETPVEYTIGIIDQGDLDPWYISYDCVEHLTGGAIKTAGWTRVEGTNTGIIVVPVVSAGRTIVTADIGFTITMDTDGDVGTLLDIIDLGETNDYFVIRPTSSASANSFDNSPTSGGGMTSSRGAFTATQALASVTGEQIWANLYNVTPVDTDTHVYMYQGVVNDPASTTFRSRVTSIGDQTKDWWAEGAFDRLFYIRDFRASGNPLIDAGYITAYARKANTLYSHFEVATSTTSGGRNPVPLSAAADINHTTGWRTVTLSTSSGNWNVGDNVTGDTSGASAIITSTSGANPTITLRYYLLGDPQTDFNGTEAVTNQDDTGAATGSGAPANYGPALASWFTSSVAPTISHTSTPTDIDDNGTTEGYGIAIDCNANPLTEVYQWLQFICQNGQTGTGNTDGIEGEQYIGGTVFLSYTGSVTGTIAEGSDVTQETSGATGVVISHDTTKKQILLRSTRGTFATHATTHTLTDNDTAGTVEIDGVATTFSANSASPFGTFAGGTFFGARGVVLTDYLAADENAFQLTDTAGGINSRPVSITLTVSNLVGTTDESGTTADRVAIFRLTTSGGPINKTEYSAVGGEAIGAATLVVDSAITSDTPGKSTGGVLRLRDQSNNNKEYRLRYSSWATSTFTLANIVVAAADSGTNTTTVVEAGAFGSVKRGDLVLNITRSNAVSYVTDVPDANTINISPAITGQTTGDNIEINAVPIVVDTLDDVFVPLLDLHATGTGSDDSASVSIVYVSQIYYKVVVRNVAASTRIKPFTSADTTAGTNRSTQTVRTTDSIYTP